MTRGLRNANPGNIRLSRVRYKGEVRPSRDSQFRTFESQAWGYRAIFVVLHTYAVRYGCRTLRRMIERYAPPTENRTDKYIEFVCRRSGIAPDAETDTLDRAAMTAVAAAISHFENGIPADAEQLAKGWELYIGDFGCQNR